MEKVPQKLDKTRKEYYQGAPIAKFGQRKPDYSGMGKRIKNAFKGLREVVCVEACRTPYGVFGGALKGFDAPQLGALAIKECLRRTGGKGRGWLRDHGPGRPRGCGRLPNRQATLWRGCPSVPSITVTKFVPSGSRPSPPSNDPTSRAKIVIAATRRA